MNLALVFCPNLRLQNIANIVPYIISSVLISVNIVWIKTDIAQGWSGQLRTDCFFEKLFENVVSDAFQNCHDI